MTAFKVWVKTSSAEPWATNQLVFDTVEEAERYADALFARWTAVTDWAVVPADPDEKRYLSDEDIEVRAVARR